MQQVPVMKEQGDQALLGMYLQALDLEAFRENYQAYAKDATRAGLPYERFLLALCESEIGLTLTRFWGVGEEKFGTIEAGGFDEQISTNLHKRIQAASRSFI